MGKVTTDLSESLLFQFTVHTCIVSHRILCDAPSPHSIAKLIGITPLRWEEGAFVKLHRYYDLLITHHPQNQCNETESAIIRLLREAKKSSSMEMIPSFKRRIKQITSLLLQRLPAFAADENVLYFILRKSGELTSLLRRPVISKEEFKRMEELLVDRYTKRGFHHLTEEIRSRIVEMK